VATSDSRISSPPWLRRAALSIALVILGVLATLWIANRLRSLLFMVFIALFVSVALEPAVQFLSNRGWRRGPATTFVFLGALLLTVGFLAALAPMFISQASGLARNLPRYVENIETWMASLDLDVGLIDPNIAQQFESLGSLISRYGTSVAGGMFAVGNTVFTVLFRLVTIALFAYYMVAEGPKLRRTVLSALPQARQREALRIWEIAVEKTGGYIYSRAVLALVAAAFTAAVLTILEVPYPIALGIWVGVLSQFVPVIGTYIAAVVPIVVALSVSGGAAIWLAVILIGYQQVENFIIAPRITARAMSLHPAISIASLIAGASLLGGIGVILALPAAATIQAVISTAVHRHELIESESLADSNRSKKSVHPGPGPDGEGGGEGVEGVAPPGVDR